MPAPSRPRARVHPGPASLRPVFPARPVLAAALVLLLVAGAGCRSSRRERPPFRKVGPPVANQILRDSPGILIVDLRSPEEFQGDTGHIEGALNIPLERLPHRLFELSSYRAETFLVYCRKDACGEEGMSVLVASGYADAILIDGGIDAWIRAGFKTVLTVEDGE